MHIDSSAHCFEGGRDVADLKIKELICPCVVIDVSKKADERYKVSIQDIENFEATYGLIKPGTFTIVYTSWSRFWSDPNSIIMDLFSPPCAQMQPRCFYKEV